MSDILWQPSPERIANTRMDQFRRFINQRHGVQLHDYPALHQWSIDQRPDFGNAAADDRQAQVFFSNTSAKPCSAAGKLRARTSAA